MTLVRGDWFYILLLFIDAFFMSRPYLYAIQQDNYRISEIFKYKRLIFVYLIDLASVAVFGGIWLIFYFLQTRAFWGFLTALFFFIAEFAMYFMEDLPERKKPLKYTKRAVRCIIFVALAATGAGTAALAVANARLENVYLRYLVFFAFPPLFPLMFMVFASIINVFERLNNARYVNRAARALAARPDLIKIAITGSYGKTSVKNYLRAMMAQKYNVLSTPESYNTPLGIAKTVRDLDATYDVFIAEFGARRVGDIKKLMKMVKPQYTALTGINAQHLETFKSEENIIKEKCRILDVDEGGFCVVNSSCRAKANTALSSKKRKAQIIYAGLNDGSEVCAYNLAMTSRGSAFDLSLGGEYYSVITPLIGRHNIEDLTIAAAVAYNLGVEAPFIIDAIEHAEAVPHRMQLINGNGITIIDDSFNSNPDGAMMAVDTLAMFDSRKVALTPGLVELGSRENEVNYNLGLKLAEVADLVMLIGVKRSDPIRRGLLDGGFGGEIHIYTSLGDAENDFKNRLRLNDTLLILNDLPDMYDNK